MAIRSTQSFWFPKRENETFRKSLNRLESAQIFHTMHSLSFFTWLLLFKVSSRCYYSHCIQLFLPILSYSTIFPLFSVTRFNPPISSHFHRHYIYRSPHPFPFNAIISGVLLLILYPVSHHPTVILFISFDSCDAIVTFCDALNFYD